VDDDDPDDDPDEPEDEDEPDEDDVDAAAVEDDVAGDEVVDSDFFASEPFDFSALTAPARESLR